MPQRQWSLVQWVSRNWFISAVVALSLSLAGVQVWLVRSYQPPWEVLVLISG